jgi:threonyl-tRNA synthetase
MPIVAKESPKSEKSERLYRIRHSAAHLMAEAVQDLFPGTHLAFGPPIEDGFYYDFDTEHKFSDEDLKQIEAKMQELRKLKAEFVCTPISKDDALKLFRDCGEKLKAEHVETLPPDNITLYTDGKFVDLCAGPHVHDTGEVKHFKLTHVSGSYWRGDEKRERLQRIYGTAWETKEELDGYLHRIEEAKKRDHRVLGKELRLFDFPELAGPGLPFYLPKGATILQEMKDWMWGLHVTGEYGHIEKPYEPLATPHILRTEAWHISGHMQNYRDNMFLVYSLDELESGMLDGRAAVTGRQSEGDPATQKAAAEGRPPETEGIGNYGLKPMNCPGHVMLYNVGTKSYRDLPVRYFEFGTVYRYERAGTLHGMLRVRSFTQDDAHLFCTPEQYESEIYGVFDFCCFVLDTFGFDYTVALKTRGEKRIGSDELWDLAENGLRKVLDERAAGKYYVEEGDATFYGPKIDFIIKDSLGRSWQGGTIQLDFNLPERFGLEYIDHDGQRKRPVMLHRAIMGSFERFFGLLLEEFGGAYPLWLAPVQARVVPITDQQNEYAHKVAAKLRSAGRALVGKDFRVEVDESNEKLGKKIRSGKTEKVPYLIVVGGQEAEHDTVTVESYFDGKLADITAVDALAGRMGDEVKRKVARRKE